MQNSVKSHNVLLTGGRAPVTLELARMFFKAGNNVYGAESISFNLLWCCRAIKKNYLLPSPKYNFPEYKKKLLEIINQEKIDLLIPTCEEIFYIAKLKSEIPLSCKVFVDDFEKLDSLHNKWSFYKKAKTYHLLVPPTEVVTDRKELVKKLQKKAKVVLKPIYSRFATRTIIYERNREIPHIPVSKKSPWIAQQYIVGKQICTFSIVKSGNIVAHCAYPSDYTWGLGSTIFFKNIHHDASFNWVKEFVKQEKFSGQIAFDFIETSDGMLYALECNPRSTSGIHLFFTQPDFIKCFFGIKGKWIVYPKTGNISMLSLGMFWLALCNIRQKDHLRKWFQDFRKGRDVIFSLRDPVPFLMELVSMIFLVLRGWKYGISATSASTYDIEFNGE